MMINTGLNNKYQFENFFENDGNDSAKKVARAVVEDLGFYNPLYIYGPSGSGKTHLLQAIGNKVLENNPEKRVKYISAEDLLENELEIQKVRSEEFDLLIVDDIQILGEKDILIQEKFLNLFNSQQYKNKQMVFSSDSEPDQLKSVHSHLIVRFKWGITASLTLLEKLQEGLQMNDQERLLTIFLRLQFGTPLGKKQLAQEFEVSEKTIQRDFSLLRDILSSHTSYSGDLLYNRKTNKYCLASKSVFNKKDILVISKILLENRALNRPEIASLLNNLLVLVPRDDRKEIEQIIGSEKLNYAPLTDQQNRIEKIWNLSEAILHEQVLDIIYQKPYSEFSKKQTVLPVSLYYDRHYFYLVVYQLKYETYITLRVDRIQSWSLSGIEKPSISYRDKFRDGDIRNERVDAFIGKKISIEIEYLYDPTIVMDQFPNAKIVGKNGDWTHFQFESQHTPGLKRWLLGQGEAVTILSPRILVEDMKQTVQEMIDKYR